MEKLSVNFKKLDSAAIPPVFSSDGAAGADLHALPGNDFIIPAGETVPVHTGIALEIPLGYVGLIYARSGLALRSGLAPANKVGVIDCDYRGEIIVALHNHSKEDVPVKGGERIAQIVISAVPNVEFCEADELSDTIRGSGGFGSTGK